ncbi:MAG: F0F1 ATP synthase subunit alpha, partial [Geminicoccaceae bacterium]|nr:F0F1 ATP synthase subunit alpha [Geminicoccaceae bacterium]
AFAQFASDLDAATQRLLNRGARLTELLKQPQYSPMTVDEQVSVIYAGVNGYLDGLPVSVVGRYEEQLLSELKSRGSDILESIRKTGDLNAETEAKLKELVENFTKNFS